eukprot:11189837-Lingulodinium_polyedra.AAC.1
MLRSIAGDACRAKRGVSRRARGVRLLRAAATLPAVSIASRRHRRLALPPRWMQSCRGAAGGGGARR